MSDTHTILSIVTFYILVIVLSIALGISTAADEDLIAFPDTTNLENAIGSFEIGGLSAFLGVFAIIGEAFILAFQLLVFIIQILAFTFGGLLPWWFSTILFLPLVMTVLWLVVRILRGVGG